MTNKAYIQQGKETRYRIIEAIIAYFNRYNRPPTIRDIQAITKIKSESTVSYHLIKLEREGIIDREPGVSRGIRLSGLGDLYSVEYKCLYPFGCTITSAKPGTCSLHGTELVPFVSRK